MPPGAAQPGQWVQPVKEPAWDEPLPYYRMLRTRSWRWWRPLLGGGVAIGSFLVGALVVQVGLLLVAMLAGEVDLGEASDAGALTEALTQSPLGLLSLLLSLAVGIPAAMAGLTVGHRLRPDFIASVRGFRWGLQGIALGVASVTFVVFLVATTIYGAATTDIAAIDSGEPTTVDGLRIGLLALVVLVAAPLQAAGEEFMIRGYLLQAFGSWLPWRRLSLLFTVVVTSVLFALLHASNGNPNAAAYVNFALFGVVAAVVTIRTGGLESAIAMHVVNNVVGLLLAVLAGDASEPLDATGTPWSYVVLNGAWMIGYAVLMDWIARRRGVATLTAVGSGLAPSSADR